MKIFYSLFFALITTPTFANAMLPFIEGLQKDLYFTQSERSRELDYHVRVKAFGPLGQVMSPDAIATYNGNLNLISLNQELLNGKVIKDAREIRGTQYATYKNSTVFHEMGHAELDVFIEDKKTPEDQALMSHYEGVLKPFYKKNFSSFNPHTVFHEHFAYYRSDLIDFIYGEVDKLFMFNGYNKFKNTCFLTMTQKKQLAENISLEDFIQIMPTADQGLSFQEQIKPQYVYVKGKDIDLFSVPNYQATLQSTYKLFWNYHRTMFNFPSNQTELIARMKEKSPVKKTIEACRTQFWNDYHKMK